MIEVCLSSIYISMIIWVLLSNLLFFVALKRSEGEIKHLIFLKLIFDAIMFITFILLLLMFKGVC